jgi:predicted Zn-dependent protease
LSDSTADSTLIRSVVGAAQQAGLAGCEALLHRTVSRTATWQTAAVTGAVILGPRSVRTLHLRCFTEDGKAGVHSARVSEDDSPAQLVQDAMSSLAKADNAGPAPRLDVPSMGLGVLDRRFDGIEDEDRAEVVSRNVAGCRSISGAECGLVRYTEAGELRTFKSTRGVELQEAGTRYTLTTVARLEDDPSVQLQGQVASRHFADVASIPLGIDLAKRVIRYQEPVPLPEGDLPLVLEPTLVARIMHAVAPAFDGNLVAAGKSFITGQADQVLGSPKLHLIDDAARSGGLATRGFDARGVPSMSIPLIREGHGGSLYQDVTAARSSGTRPTGHQSPDGTPWLGNLILRSGNRSRNMMFPEIGSFLMLDSLVTPEVDLDLATGALNLEVHTFLAVDGVRSSYLGVQRFETDLITLWSAIQEIGSDQQRHGQVDVSTWILSPLPVVR